MARGEHEIAVEKCRFYLPPVARYDYLLNLPENENLAQKVQNAMEEIEHYNPFLVDTLPKDVYYKIVKQSQSVLFDLLKLFKDIPSNVELDIFGEIYEYFLGKFALAEGQGGGEFFTPSSVVRYMVEVLRRPREKFWTLPAEAAACLCRPRIISSGIRKKART